MKNKILALLATIGLASSVSAVEINKNLSINGFIDGSWQDRSEDIVNRDSQDVSVDEVELNFLLNVGNVSGEIHLDNQNPDSAPVDNINVEQAHFTYTLDNGLSITFGRYGSKLGLEREDPAGLYTFSRAYGDNGYNVNNTAGNVDAINYGDVDSLVMEGVAFGYAAETFALSVSLDQNILDNSPAPANLKAQGEGLNYEVAVSYTGVDNLVANIGYRANNVEGTTTIDKDETHINVNATYTIGKALIAAEWQEASNKTVAANTSADNEAFQFLVDYDFNDKLGAAIRYSNEDQDTDSTTGYETSKFTIAPNYAITDSLGLIVEYTTADVDSAPSAAADDYDFIAAELTFTF